MQTFLRVLLAATAIMPLGFAQTQTITYSYSGVPLPIYPDDWNVAAVATVLVPRGLTITRVTASVQVQFGGVGDLNVYLFSPQTTRTKLLERNCGSLANIDTTFDDIASNTFAEFCPAEAGRGPFRGNEPLGNYNGQNAYGYWKLAVENNASGTTGYLTGFSITITGTPTGVPIIDPKTILSTSSFKGGGVAPGEQLALFGANLGPIGGTWANVTAPLPTNISNTSVTFDGVAVPLFFAADRGVIVHVPFGVTPGATAKIAVTSSSGTSSVVSVPVVPAKPGIYTYESGGVGQAKAVNQDGTVNGDGSVAGTGAAARGTVVQLYCSGLGPVSPAVNAGVPAPSNPLSRATLPISVTIGGIPGTVTYAGLAPTLIGAYQVNVMIPALTPVGPNRIVLTAGGNTSQDDVTIQVK